MTWIRLLRRTLRASVGALALTSGASEVAAQIPKLTVEGRVGAVVPTGELGESGATSGNAQAGVSFGVGFAYAVRGGLYLDLGFGQHRFSCEDGCSGNGDLTATGFDLALRYLLDVGTVRPWVQVGALPYTVEGETADPDGLPRVSGHTWGYEVGAGIALPVSESVWLSPGARFISLEPELTDGRPLPFQGWVVDMGVAWAF